MSYDTSAADCKSSASSTGTDPAGWHHWWREQSLIDGTDWPTLYWQHIGALRAVCALTESSGAAP